MPEPEDQPPFWPFPAAAQITEVLEWRTDILSAQAGEQRIALRPQPREIITFQHRCDALGMARAAELSRAGFAGDWRVPLWHLALQPTADLAQGATEILLDTTVSDFRAAGFAVLAIDGREAVLVEIVTVAADRILLTEPLGMQLPSVAAARIAIAPVRQGVLASAIEITRRRQSDGMVTATFLLRDAADLTAPVSPSYLGRPVQTNPSLVRSPLSASFRRAVEYVDNGFGPVVVEPLRDVFERGDGMILRNDMPGQDKPLKWGPAAPKDKEARDGLLKKIRPAWSLISRIAKVISEAVQTLVKAERQKLAQEAAYVAGLRDDWDAEQRAKLEAISKPLAPDW